MDFDGLSHLMNASEKLEMGIAELYSVFGKALPEDRTFWEQLSFEEKNHADLIASIHETFIPLGEEFPTSILAWTRTEVDKANQIVTDYLAAFADAAPDREKIFNAALDLELAAGEIHFQCFMKKKPENILEEMFQQLNQEDKDHSQRIHAYMQQHGIAITQRMLFPHEPEECSD
ncbi:MAG: rubrerythrin family protein [Desulfobulbia bacterium]